MVAEKKKRLSTPRGREGFYVSLPRDPSVVITRKGNPESLRKKKAGEIPVLYSKGGGEKIPRSIREKRER